MRTKVVALSAEEIVAVPYVAYYRVSGKDQERSGLGLDSQKAMVQRYLDADKRRRKVAEFEETMSGWRKDRPKLKEALDECKRRRAKLVVAVMDRVARNVGFLCEILDSGTQLVAVDFPNADRTLMQMRAVFAEYEHHAGSRRMKAIWDVRKKDPKRMAKWKRSVTATLKAKGTTVDQVYRKGAAASAAVRTQKANEHKARMLETVKRLRGEGKDKRTLQWVADEMNKLGLLPPRGGQWHPATVARIFAA
jgi:DNA invertase Pin-like site-specific DNA recombinase